MRSRMQALHALSPRPNASSAENHVFSGIMQVLQLTQQTHSSRLGQAIVV